MSRSDWIRVGGHHQGSGRLLLVRKGSVLLGHFPDPLRAAESAFFSDLWRLGETQRLRTAIRESVIYAWYIANVTQGIASDLHRSLASEPLYLGMHAVDLSRPVHWTVYRRWMPLAFRLEARRCWVFYSEIDRQSGADVDGPDWDTFRILASTGFDEVHWEDVGLRDSGWDLSDSKEHCERIGSLRQVLRGLLPDADDADKLLLLLEDLSPPLASTLGTAARTYRAAVSPEDFAQAATSARRYMDQLADALFPARSEPVKGRSVSRDKVKNRLWAYTEEALQGSGIRESEGQVRALGGEVNRLYGELSTLLHGTPDRRRMGTAIGDLAALTVALLLLAPERNRDPLSAYATEFLESVRRLIRRTSSP